ncbi:MAG: hypothetical protein NVS1B10_08600 [Candidatus Saccharimonadales bacterium]
MTNQDLIDLIDFVTFRFYGDRIDDRMLQNTIQDWKGEKWQGPTVYER